MAACVLPSAAHARGARLYKTGPIQITADGRDVWTANGDNRSVSRLDTIGETVEEFPLAGCSPRGISVRDDGEQVWVTCPDSDAVLVIDGRDGSEIARIALPYGSGPAFVALSPDQSRAVVTLNRSGAIAVLDTALHALSKTLPTGPAPLGAAWTNDGAQAWITHATSDGERTFVTQLDVTGTEPRIGARAPIGMQEPQASYVAGSPIVYAEGGAVTLRGHLAQIPAASGSDAIWLPAQHSGVNDPVARMDTTIQAAVHRLDPRTATVSPADRLVLTAVQAHDPTDSGWGTGPGWDARVSGFIDIGFSIDGVAAYLVGESSEDILVVPTTLEPFKASPGEAPLTEIPVGQQPTGIAMSPTQDVAFVLDSIENEVSIVDLAGQRELARTPVNVATGDRLSATLRLGRRIFNTSAMRQASGNQKVACASCHSGGELDGLIWHFETLTVPIGPRPTTSMLGLSLTFGPIDSVTRLGQLHRAGDRDEIQDFEHTFRDLQMGGSGFFVAPPNPYQGPSNSGRAPEMDAMAAFMLSLPAIPRSPERDAAGDLSEAAVRGAGLFRGSAGRAGDAGCVTCHVPGTGFSDRKFHDVGSARPSQERQISTRTPTWQVNTPTLIGLWATAPYDDAGSGGDQRQDLVDVLADFARRDGTSTPHGHLSDLTRRQLSDLAAFVLSIDGSTTATEVATTVDRQPPRLTRAEPISTTRIACWFSETVDPAFASSPSNWRVIADDGTEIRVLEARWDATWGDRVTLIVEPLLRDCANHSFTVMTGPIFDAAAWTTGGVANALRTGSPDAERSFVLGDSITVTLGSSTDDHVAVDVFDAGMAGPDSPFESEDEPWIRRVRGPVSTRGFVRFGWMDPFREATGVTSAADIVGASFSLQPEWGASQPVLARRMLQQWSDPHAGDGDTAGAGAPTWYAHGRGLGAWNAPGAGVLGGRGDDPLDYFGAFDLADAVDATGVVTDLSSRTTFGGSGVTDAYRFWFDNPSLDMGHALEIPDGVATEIRFARSERAFGSRAPRLMITYLLPAVPHPAPEISGDASDRPLLVQRAGADLVLSFADDVAGTDHEIFEGEIGSWYSHAGSGCTTPLPSGSGRLEIVQAAAAGNRYLLIGASSDCGSGLGLSSVGNPLQRVFVACVP